MNITNKDINRLREGDIPYPLQNRPFVILRQKVKMRFAEDCIFQWTLDWSPDSKDTVDVDRKSALDIIEANNMKMTVSNKDGQIYELPGNPFYETYKNYFKFTEQNAS